MKWNLPKGLHFVSKSRTNTSNITNALIQERRQFAKNLQGVQRLNYLFQNFQFIHDQLPASSYFLMYYA
jgi:hypothetical protein